MLASLKLKSFGVFFFKRLCRRKTLHLDGMTPALWSNIMMRKKWFHILIAAWTGHWSTGLNPQPLLLLPTLPFISDKIKGDVDIMLTEDHPSIRQLFCLGWFFFPEGKSSYITTKTFFLFNFYAARLLWSHCVGPWRAVSRMIPGRSRNPSWKYIFFLGFFPRIPHRELCHAGRRMDGLGSSPISAVEVSWSPSRADGCLQSTKPRRPPQRLTPGPLKLCAERNSAAPQERAQTQTSSSKTAAGPANTNSFSTSIIRGFHQHVEPFVSQK